MTRLDSKLYRALVFLSASDQSVQHLAKVFAIGEVVYFSIALGHETSIQRCALVELADLLQKPAGTLKAHIRSINKPDIDTDLQTRLEMARTQKEQLTTLQKLLKL